MTMEETTIVTILTPHYKIKGSIGLLAGARLTDYMNQAKGFIAVTDAEVFEIPSGKKISGSNFINVQCHAIEIIMPADQETSV